MGKRKKYCCIYGLFGPDRTVYIGQTIDPINRKSRYKTMTCKNQRLVYESLKKHGFKNHTFKVLHVFDGVATRDQLDYHESFFYYLYMSLGFRLLNLKTPGWNGVPSESSKILMSQSHKGRCPWNKGLTGVQVAWNKGLKKNDYENRNLLRR